MSSFPGLTINNQYQLTPGTTVPSSLDLTVNTMNAMTPDLRRLFLLRRYSVLEGLLVTPSGKIEHGGGAYGVEQRMAVTDNNAAARGNRLFGTQVFNQQDYMRVKITPWVIDEVTWQYDSRLIARNQDAAQIVNMMNEPMQDSLRGLLNRLENQFVGTPASASDDVGHTGLLWWCRGLNTNVDNPNGSYDGVYSVYGDGTLTPQLSRGNASCDSSDPTNSRLRGWAFTHDGTYSTFLVRQMRYALQQSDWRTPTFFSGIQGPTDRQWAQFRIYWNDSLNNGYADAVNSGPDDRGNGSPESGNMNPYYGDLKFGPAQTVPTPVLNGIAGSPILGVNHALTRLKIIRGQWLQKSGAIVDSNQMTVAKQLIWCQSCIDCEDVRSNWIGHTVR